MLRVAIIGVGGRGRAHLNTLMKLRNFFEVVALCDVDPSRLSIARDLGVRAFTSVEKMLSSVKVDVALVAIHPEGHHIVTRVLAENGVHVLSETPIAYSLKCARDMIKVCEKYGVFLEVSENVPRWPRERLKRKLVEEGVLGGLKGFYLSYTSGSYHGMAAIRSLLGLEAIKVRGEYPPPNSIFERGFIEFPNIKGVYELNADKGNYWEIYGEKGVLKGGKLYLDKEVYELEVEYSIVNGKRIVTGARVETKPPVVWENPYRGFMLESEDDVARADAWLSLYNAIEYGRELNYGAENALKDLELVFAVRESAMRSEEITLPLKGELVYEELLHREYKKFYGFDPLEAPPEALNKKYYIPEELQMILYYGRLDAWKSSKYRPFYK